MTKRYTSFGVVERSVALADSGVAFLGKLRDASHPAPPFAEVTEIWPLEVESGRVVFEGVPTSRFYNPMGTVHGGWIAMLLDTAMGCAVHSLLKAGQTYTTVEMKLNFVRPVFENTGAMTCEGKIVHCGSRLATSEGRIVDRSGNLVAHGSETCMILTPSSG